jgi:two-component system chemotaxis sensor kinase CheA
VETLHATNATLYTVGRQARLVANRGELLPIIDLAEVFDLSGDTRTDGRGVLIVVECDGGRRAALKVDHIEDQRQVVIKSIEENYGNVFGVSAATILGNGRIALIVDPDEIISSATAGIRRPALTEAV